MKDQQVAVGERERTEETRLALVIMSVRPSASQRKMLGMLSYVERSPVVREDEVQRRVPESL
jgi:hypothetical protein